MIQTKKMRLSISMNQAVMNIFKKALNKKMKRENGMKNAMFVRKMEMLCAVRLALMYAILNAAD